MSNMCDKGTPKKFDSAGEIQIWKDVGFWLNFQFLCHMAQKNWIFFSILFVALSHCDKQKICLSHWITAINKKKLCVALSHCNKQNLYMLPKSCKQSQQCSIILHFLGYSWHFLRTFLGTVLCVFLVFGNFLVTYTNFVCCSNSVRQIKILFVALTQFNRQYWKNIKFLCCM